ncbi:MAG: hypothetical protein KJS74_03385 [Rhodospirillales bacterium]|nr:hypothetical protein [Rhodospirillales bacterium]
MRSFVFMVTFICMPVFSQAQSVIAPKVLTIASAGEVTSIPVTGCNEQGMVGDASTPPATSISLKINPAIAAHLSLYYGLNLFVLAPRGWICAVTQGADGSYLIARPGLGEGPLGPAIYIENFPQDPNGWAMIAAYGGTYFPKMVSNVSDAVKQLNEQGGNTTLRQFLAPRYPKDQIKYLNNSVLTYMTPPGKQGLGTIIGHGLPSDFRNDPNISQAVSRLPTYGIVGVVSQPDTQFLNLMTIRLPANEASFYSTIMGFTAHCQPFDQSAACVSAMNFLNEDK